MSQPPVLMTCREIQEALFRAYDTAGSIICFNSTKVLCHEADVLVLRKSGVTIEVEVKVSRSDFMADFRKVEKHKQMQRGYKHGPQYFYYAAEPHVIPLDKVPAYAGLLHVFPAPQTRHISETRVVVAKKAPRLHKEQNEGIHERICRTLMYKAWQQF